VPRAEEHRQDDGASERGAVIGLAPHAAQRRLAEAERDFARANGGRLRARGGGVARLAGARADHRRARAMPPRRTARPPRSPRSGDISQKERGFPTMTTTTPTTSPAFLRLLAPGAALALVALAGCAGPRAATAGPYTFTIRFAGNCPAEVTMAEAKRNCTHLLGSADRDCAKVSRDRKDVVEFVADPPGGEFEVYFDPFKRQPFRSKEGREGRVVLGIDPATPYKTYEFYVVSGECPVLDPRIVVQP
jgi:hypothetical protein